MDFSALTFIKSDTMKELESAMSKFEINTPLRSAHFLSQCKHESANFTRTMENLNYSANGLRGTFPKYFPDIDTALHYEKQPEKIANRVYANRMGNGDEASGDGWKHRGFGYIQITGKDNQTKFIATCKEKILPEQIAQPKYAALSAAWFFQTNGLNNISDEGGSDATIQTITKRINGGLTGISDRIANFKQIFPLIKIV